MDKELQQLLVASSGASSVKSVEPLQSLWSGYGSIDRYHLQGADRSSVIVKHVRLPKDTQRHPRGWNTSLSHQRKLQSYQIETHWYADWAGRCTESCRVPHTLALHQRDGEFLLVLEDLDSSGFPLRHHRIGVETMQVCLRWLASFHALFMGETPEGLWSVGTYWHLATRPDEWDMMADGPLKQSAALLDQQLNEAPFPTLVHGDAKLANFCFSADGQQVAAVDFQYVGGGCGMKDVAYFIGSCLNETACARHETALLAGYFQALTEALMRYQPQLEPAAVEAAWRPLYAVAWADFYRFLQGWSPGHPKLHAYSERLTQRVLRDLGAY